MAWCAEQFNQQYSKLSPVLLWCIAVTFNHGDACKTAAWMFGFSETKQPHPALPGERSCDPHKEDSCHSCEQLAVFVLTNHGHEPRALSGVEVCRKATVPLGRKHPSSLRHLNRFPCAPFRASGQKKYLKQYFIES